MAPSAAEPLRLARERRPLPVLREELPWRFFNHLGALGDLSILVNNAGGGAEASIAMEEAEWLRAELGSFLKPKFVESLPKTPSGRAMKGAPWQHG